MFIINVEVYSLLFAVLILIDYKVRFKYYYNNNSKKYFKLIICIITLSVINILMMVVSDNDSLRYILLAISFFISFFPPFILYQYIEENYLKSKYYLGDKKFLTILYPMFVFLAIILIFNQKYGLEEVPLYITGSSYYNRILIFSLFPIIVLLIEYIFKGGHNNRILGIILLCIGGVITELLITDIYLFTATYTITTFLLYSDRHDELINKDKLTGLYNREIINHFNDCRRKLKATAIYMIDVDYFKTINDTYGHNKGDEILKTIASILTTSVRQSDYVIRYGGDEFLIIAKIASKKDIDVISNKIYYNVDKYNADHLIKISLSIGSDILLNKYDLQKTIANTDKKMYKIKARRHKKEAVK